MDEGHQDEPSTRKYGPPAAFDIIYLADGERGKGTMNAVAAEWFEQYPACNFVMVYEDAIWWLTYQRGKLERVGMANDLAIMPDG